MPAAARVQPMGIEQASSSARAPNASPGVKRHHHRRRDEHGDRHTSAQRNLVNRLLGQLYHCLQHGQRLDEIVASPTGFCCRPGDLNARISQKSGGMPKLCPAVRVDQFFWDHRHHMCVLREHGPARLALRVIAVAAEPQRPGRIAGVARLGVVGDRGRSNSPDLSGTCGPPARRSKNGRTSGMAGFISATLNMMLMSTRWASAAAAWSRRPYSRTGIAAGHSENFDQRTSSHPLRAGCPRPASAACGYS